jgi:hypothetical protein
VIQDHSHDKTVNSSDALDRNRINPRLRCQLTAFMNVYDYYDSANSHQRIFGFSCYKSTT